MEYIPRKPQNIYEYYRDHKPVFLAPYETEASKDYYDMEDSVISSRIPGVTGAADTCKCEGERNNKLRNVPLHKLGIADPK